MSTGEPVPQTQPAHVPTASSPRHAQARNSPDIPVLQTIYSDVKYTTGLAGKCLLVILTSVLGVIWGVKYLWGWWGVFDLILPPITVVGMFAISGNIVWSILNLCRTHNILASLGQGVCAAWTYLAECHRDRENQCGIQGSAPPDSPDEQLCEIQPESAEDDGDIQQSSALDEVNNLLNTIEADMKTLGENRGKVFKPDDAEYFRISTLTTRITANLDVVKRTHATIQDLLRLEALDIEDTINQKANDRMKSIKKKIFKNAEDRGWSCRVM